MIIENKVDLYELMKCLNLTSRQKLTIVFCKELPQWIISSNKAAYHPYSNTIYLTSLKYLLHELLHWFAFKFKINWIHKVIDKGTN